MPTNTFILSKLEPAEWLKLNAALQAKKNAVRKELATRGVLAKEGINSFDKYKYFSEAQYKILFTQLFSKYGLELTFDEEDYSMYQGTEKQSQGRTVRLAFTLTDVTTGFSETGAITGEGMDKGDKAGYKAYTGALKYYLANTFMVATGDDPENETLLQPAKAAPVRKPAAPAPAGRAEMNALFKQAKAAGMDVALITANLKALIPGKESKEYTADDYATACEFLKDALAGA